jgi:hypothetical protein
MKLITCDPLKFAQSLTKSQRRALEDILRFRGRDDRTAKTLQTALEHAK